MVRSNGLGELRRILNPAARRSKCWLGLPNGPATAPFFYLITSDHPPPSKVQREPLHDPAGYGTSVSAIDREPHPASQYVHPCTLFLFGYHMSSLTRLSQVRSCLVAIVTVCSLLWTTVRENASGPGWEHWRRWCKRCNVEYLRRGQHGV